MNKRHKARLAAKHRNRGTTGRGSGMGLTLFEHDPRAEALLSEVFRANTPESRIRRPLSTKNSDG